MKKALNASARTLLKRARSRRAGLVSPKTGRARELRLVNAILEERRIPTPAEQDHQEVAWPVAPHLEEITSALPDGVGPGALVEVRWNNRPRFGVVLREVHVEGRNFIQTLLADGRIVDHLAYDILFAVPEFTDPFHVKRCGVEEKPVSTKELMARVSAAEKVRTFNKSSEDLFNGYATLFNSVYPSVSAPDEEAWASVTVAEAAKIMKVQHRDRNLVLHAVYSRLMRHSQMFVMDSHNFLLSQTFYVRPRAHVERFNRVKRLMYSDGEHVKQFSLRATEIISRLRKKVKKSKNQTPSYHPAADTVFTEDDQLFIRFILDSLVEIRSVQNNPYTPYICDIIKSLGLYDGDVDSEQVHQFLIDLGVLPPWQDIASLTETQPALMTPPPNPAHPKKGKQVSRPTIISSSLGPNDFYPTDPLESMRHDFGQLPVYTIDDYGAQELDDGISVEPDVAEPSSLWVHVHVADPTAILPPTHSLARCARNATHTLYFHNGSRTMLPESLVNDKLSLGSAASSGKPENVLTFSAKVDPSGDIVDYKVRAGVIRDVRTVRYDDIDATMSFRSPLTTYPFGRPSFSTPTPASPSLSSADMENLHLLYLFSKRMVARRLDQSAFFFGLESPELRMSPKPLHVGVLDLMHPGLFLGYPQISYAVRKAYTSGSREIVAEAAQVANRVASRFGRDNGVPLMRRSLAAPVGSDDVLGDLLKLRDENGWVDFFEVRRRDIQFPSSRYTFEAAGHWTLGVGEGEGYTRATSPLRRYGDLVTHWQIKHALHAQ
ncbi:hypothetical protein F5148DRAFT_1009000 [Russula earlei]|uniref:Uncharacterized protein n=1 Tax=Russula earlei TaxID=71964 RepID=A0ACC0UJZ9_9AGAM|nr:hypothetical protein F5148DRAFT_1009000 [Russula earlei]